MAIKSDAWEIVSKAMGAIALTILSFAIDAIRDMSKDIGDLKVAMKHVVDSVERHEVALDRILQRK